MGLFRSKAQQDTGSGANSTGLKGWSFFGLCTNSQFHIDEAKDEGRATIIRSPIAPSVRYPDSIRKGE